MTTATKKSVQAKSITDEEVFRAMVRCQRFGDHLVSRFDIQDELSLFPWKVVLAKLRSMVKRDVLHGCTCGCRGNFRRTP